MVFLSIANPLDLATNQPSTHDASTGAASGATCRIECATDCRDDEPLPFRASFPPEFACSTSVTGILFSDFPLQIFLHFPSTDRFDQMPSDVDEEGTAFAAFTLWSDTELHVVCGEQAYVISYDVAQAAARRQREGVVRWV